MAKEQGNWSVGVHCILTCAIALLAFGSIVGGCGNQKPLSSVGTTFKECEVCPTMVVVAPGSFQMGSTLQEQNWAVANGRARQYTDRENPRHLVRIARPFAVGAFEVTRGEYAEFVKDTGRKDAGQCGIAGVSDGKFERIDMTGKSWRDPGFPQDDRHPVVCLSWDDAKAYTIWLSNLTGASYRLLSEAEWEYVARAGSSQYRYWGNDVDAIKACGYANLADATLLPSGETWPRASNCSDGYWGTSPVGSYMPNAFAVYDMLGNVWERVEDCSHETYVGAPSDGRVWNEGGDCTKRMIRGGSLHEGGGYVRAAVRGAFSISGRNNTDGFRVARDID